MITLSSDQLQGEMDARSIVIDTRWARIEPRLDDDQIRMEYVSKMLAKLHDTPMEERMLAHGIHHPILTVQAARQVNVNVAVICASLIMETGDRDVFGHDPVRNPISGYTHEYVTKALYMEYLKYRNEGLGCQGVGPGQLTSAGLQDTCDREFGGTWALEPNTRMDALFMKQLIDEYGSVELGFQHYNGAGPAAVAYGQRALSIYESLLRDGIN
jgi:hypothetical protein